jgi:hypothetical protein
MSNRIEITVGDCENLYQRFKKYTETAEQHEFVVLAMVNVMLDSTMARIRSTGEVWDQKDARAMFRVVMSVIGEDASMYEEVTE